MSRPGTAAKPSLSISGKGQTAAKPLSLDVPAAGQRVPLHGHQVTGFSVATACSGHAIFGDRFRSVFRDLQSFLSPRSRDLKAPAADDSKSKVDSDYIKVLQQQIFFLELKLNLMKKQAPAGGPTADTMAVPDGPLEDVIVSLRAKYIRLEQDYLRQIQVPSQRCLP